MTEHEFYREIKRLHDECMEAKRQARNALTGLYVAMGLAASALVLSGSVIVLRYFV